MKTNVFTLLTGFFLIVLIFGSCRAKVSCELTDEEKKAVSKEIETRVRNHMNANILGYQTQVGLRANVEGYVFGAEGKILFTSYDDFEKHMKTSFAGNQKYTELEILSLYPYVLCRDAAACTTLFKGKWLTASGDTVVSNGCWTAVFKKFGNEWKVVQENATHTKD